MSVSLEELVAQAKVSGAATDSGKAVIYWNFSKDVASGSVGAKKTGLFIPANTIVTGGFLRAGSNTTGGFNVQAVTAEDLIAAQTALTAGATVDVTQVDVGASDREVIINVGTTATGQILLWLHLMPY